MSELPTHFKGKDAISHVAEAQARGRITALEIHGTEVPAPLSAASDAIRDTCIVFLLLIPLFTFSHLEKSWGLLVAFLMGWTAWKAGRAAWLGWSRLERLHRVLEQEKWEIEHNRSQERDELRILYQAKGFEGKLLEDVLDVLMADGDRLLRVMVEEELGLSLENLDHPFKQGLFAGLGALLSGLVLIASYLLGQEWLMAVLSLILIAIAATILAKSARNRLIPAITWNVALAALAFGLTYFSLQLIT